MGDNSSGFGQKCPGEHGKYEGQIVNDATANSLVSKVQAIIFALFHGAIAKYHSRSDCVVL